jgi:hypothetical protein
MARRTPRQQATETLTLTPQRTNCLHCGKRLSVVRHNYRTVVTLHGVCRLRLVKRQCLSADCPGPHRVIGPEEAGRWALPESEIGLDIIAQIGSWRYRDQRSVPQMHALLREQGVILAQRSVTNALYRYDELTATCVRDAAWGQAHLQSSGAVLALDGLQPDVGHEVLWVIRDVVTGTILLARSLLSAAEDDLVPLLTEVRDRLTTWEIPLLGAISDGQHSVRQALATALPGVAQQVCQFHYLREAARPLFEADRHAKKELKKAVRGVRSIERALEGAEDERSQVAHEYCLAVRAALTDDGQPPLAAAGLRLRDRLEAIEASLERVRQKGG